MTEPARPMRWTALGRVPGRTLGLLRSGGWPLLTLIATVLLVLLVQKRGPLLVEAESDVAPLFFQAFLGAQFAAMALVFAGVSVGLQMRSQALGSEAVLALLSKHLVVPAALYATASLGLTGFVLARWDSTAEMWSGRVPDLAVVGALSSVGLMGIVSIGTVRRVNSAGHLVTLVRSLAGDDGWRRGAKEFYLTGEPSRPTTLRVLSQLLVHSARDGDYQLFEDIVLAWRNGIFADPFYERRRAEMADIEGHEALAKHRANEVLSREEAELLWALDQAHSDLARAVAAVRPAPQFAVALVPLVRLSEYPGSPDLTLFPRISFGPPGMSMFTVMIETLVTADADAFEVGQFVKSWGNSLVIAMDRADALVLGGNLVETDFISDVRLQFAKFREMASDRRVHVEFASTLAFAFTLAPARFRPSLLVEMAHATSADLVPDVPLRHPEFWETVHAAVEQDSAVAWNAGRLVRQVLDGSDSSTSTLDRYGGLLRLLDLLRASDEWAAANLTWDLFVHLVHRRRHTPEVDKEFADVFGRLSSGARSHLALKSKEWREELPTTHPTAVKAILQRGMPGGESDPPVRPDST